MSAEDKSGRRYGMLYVIERGPDKIRESGRKDIMFWCLCDCGNTVLKRSDQLVDPDRMVNCGCFIGRGNKGKHWRKDNPVYKRRLYSIWSGMKNRCNNPKEPSFKNYGGRGIKVCKEWENDYGVFEEWAITNGYQDDLTIDRIDVNGNYEPANCRWATPREQSNNKRNTNYMTLNGITKSRADWARETGISLWTLRVRVEELGWSDEKALTTPVNSTRNGKKPYNTIYEDENGFIPSTYNVMALFYDFYNKGTSNADKAISVDSISKLLNLPKNQVSRSLKILRDKGILVYTCVPERTETGHPYNRRLHILTDNKEIQDKYRSYLN